MEAGRYTAQVVSAKTAALAAGQLAPDISIVVFGSSARDELTEGSDDDWAVLVAREFADYDVCHLRSADQMRDFLTGWLTASPSDRVAAAFLHYGAIDEAVRTFAAYDRWIAIMQDRPARDERKTLRAATRDGSELWQDIRSIGEELQRGLNVLLFDTPLRTLAPQYAIF